MHTRTMWLPMAAACALAAAGGPGSLAQDDPTEDAAVRDAAGAIPEACSAAICFAVSLTPELDAVFADEDGATLAEVADGLALSYRGEEPVYARLIASRFDGGRLVRYGVSPRVETGPEGAPLDTAAIEETLFEAFRPVTEPATAVRSIADAGGETDHEVSAAAFIGATPFAALAGAEGAGLITVAGGEEITDTPYGGSVGVIALVPDDSALRDGEAAQTFGVVVALDHSARDES